MVLECFTMPVPIEREKEIFLAALEKPTSDRAGFVRETCGSDPELLERVQALLNANEETGGVFASAASESGNDNGTAARPQPPLSIQKGQLIAGRYKLL